MPSIIGSLWIALLAIMVALSVALGIAAHTVLTQQERHLFELQFADIGKWLQ